MGKSGHIAKKIAATMASTGTPSLFLHPGEAAHGDLGMIQSGDSVLAFTKSGTTAELFPVLQRAMELGAVFVLVSENDHDGMAFHATETIKIPALKELWHKAPTISTLLQMAVGDAIATQLTWMNADFEPSDFHLLHPGGAIGAAA
jgi:arabinose-5-phosphate isomerase